MPGGNLREWAAARGLKYEAEGLLPPIASVLKKGLGVGTHRVGFKLTRHEERESRNLCKGNLPGGVEGVLAHHRALMETVRGQNNERHISLREWTVVVARLPERSRAARWVSVDPANQRGPLVIGSPAPGPPRPEAFTGELDGRLWRVEPVESQETLGAFANEATRAALAAAPAETRVELHEGVLCVWVEGAVEDAGTLDALCRVASGLAAGARQAVAAQPILDAATSCGPPKPSAYESYLEQGADLVSWSSPPASIAVAFEAYQGATGASGRPTRRRAGMPSLIGWSFVGAVVGACLLPLADVWSPAPLAAAGVFAACVLIGIAMSRRESSRMGERLDAQRAAPYAVHAFAREYARARGLVPEDPDEVRRRFPAPLAGHPSRAMHGDLGGVPGHLLIWRDSLADQHWLLAVVPSPGTDVQAPAPYLAERAGGLLTVGIQVAQDDRSVARLDALRELAVRLAASAAVPAGA